MSLDFADILREHWPDYVRAHYKRLCKAHYRAVRSVLTCRTPAMGGRLYRSGPPNKRPHSSPFLIFSSPSPSQVNSEAFACNTPRNSMIDSSKKAQELSPTS